MRVADTLRRSLSDSWQGWQDRFPRLGQIVSNLGWRFADRALHLAVALTVGIQVVRYLGPEQFGLFATGLAALGMAQAVAGLSLRPVVVRSLLENPKDEPEILGSSAVLIAISSAVSFALLGVVAFTASLSEPSLGFLLLILATTLCLTPLLDPLNHRFQANLTEKYSVIAANTGLLVSAAIRIGLILLVADLAWFAIALAVETLIRAAICFVCFKKTGGVLLSWRPRLERVRAMFLETAPLLIALIASIFYHRLDTVMLKLMAGNASAGIYGAAARLSEVFYFIPAALGASLLPSIFSASKKEPALYRARLQSYLKLSAAIAYALALIITLSGPAVVGFLYGKEYAAASGVLVIHTWAAVPFFLGWARQEFFTAEGLLKLTLPVTLAGAVLNVGLNFWLIPLWHEVGAAVATLVSYLVAYFITSFFFRRSRAFGFMQLRALIHPIPSFRNLHSETA